jgi:hypothetical protein
LPLVHFAASPTLFVFFPLPLSPRDIPSLRIQAEWTGFDPAIRYIPCPPSLANTPIHTIANPQRVQPPENPARRILVGVVSVIGCHDPTSKEQNFRSSVRGHKLGQSTMSAPATPSSVLQETLKHGLHRLVQSRNPLVMHLPLPRGRRTWSWGTPTNLLGGYILSASLREPTKKQQPPSAWPWKCEPLRGWETIIDNLPDCHLV